MENLNLDDAPPMGGAPPLGPGPPQQSPQLPPQMFTTAAQLLDMTDKKLMVALRDGRKLIGVLRSWDQFANLVLQQTVERIFVPPPSSGSPNPETGSTPQPGLYADVPRGIFLVRGENVLLLGEIDLDKDDDAPPGYEKAEVELVNKLHKERKAKEARKEKIRLRRLGELGFEGESTGEALI
ncbi:small nuclear ribonucleoprotein [Phlyctema vagabunda]|uniref:U6 snRNA-associated Sm-like protein LSm1 n=1 Tax=Phlyctema vagabunda TaxID=108571 RepID=A0ABR4PGI2_9HELO